MYLTAPLEEIMNRVRRRGRPDEATVDSLYLEVLQRHYDRLIRTWTKCPIIVVDTALVDFVTHDDLLRDIGRRIEGQLTPQT